MNPALVDAWNIETLPKPSDQDLDAILRFAVRYAILAPSSHNSQPWMFRVFGGSVSLLADRTRALPVVDPVDRELTISCGAALMNLRLALRYFGKTLHVDYLPEGENSDVLARVTVVGEESPTAEERQLFEQIPRRHTNRFRFEPTDVPIEVQGKLERAALSEGARVLFFRTEEERNVIADLVSIGDRKQGSDARFRRELAAWLHPNRTESRDGLPGYAFGFGDLASYIGPLVVRTFDLGSNQAARDRELAKGSPLIGLVVTAEDSETHWMRCGEALARILLVAGVENVSASFLNQPIEVDELRPRVRKLSREQGWPQLLLRFGYGPAAAATPRRPVADVLRPGIRITD